MSITLTLGCYDQSNENLVNGWLVARIRAHSQLQLGNWQLNFTAIYHFCLVVVATSHFIEVE